MSEKKKILILGNSANAYSLAKKLSENNEIFAASGNNGMKEFAQCVDIRESSVNELLDFALENGIDMVIPVSQASLNTELVKLFQKHKLSVFAPDNSISRVLTDKAGTKKLLYKLHIPTPKFGIFEKQNMANDYIKNVKCPFVIKTNEPSSAVILTSQQSSKKIVDTVFAKRNPKIIIEDYVYGVPFCFYTITDGYKALPIGSSIIYKYSLEGDGGQLTSGMGACSPNYKLSLDNEDFLMNSVIYPTIEYFEAQGNPYTGILGVNGVISEDGTVKILGYQTFMQNSDCDGILGLLDCDLYRLFETCIIGAFSDEYDYIKQKNLSAVSVVLQCTNQENNENVINGLEKVDENIIISLSENVNKNKYLEYEADFGSVAVFTAIKGTVSSAAKLVYDEIKNIDFKGLKYRKDICKPINSDF